ncbi:LamG domain-containing protein [Ramlibacter montanisoli]|uniref:LamG domain-containing protein n=1 Tax=Ramlibacter montanisoli TaxID=2732512 RepID=UPI0028160D91|nr:LamG domain-containing protein [Ramlibacter montanisoli]
MTMEAWVTLGSFTNSYMPLFYKGAGDGTLGAGRTFALFAVNGGGLLLSTGDGSEQFLSSPSALVTPGVRTHVAATIDRDAGTMAIFVDGTQVASGSVRTGNATASASPLTVGFTSEPFGGFGPFVGRIEDVRLWNVARSAAELDAARSTEVAPGTPGLLLDWRLDEGAGTLLADNSGLGHAGSFSGLLDKLTDAVAGRIEVPGQRVVYTLDLLQPKQVVFDSLADTNFTWTLEGPRGTHVSARSFQGSDSREWGTADGYIADFAAGNRLVHELAPGRYTFTIDAPGMPPALSHGA